MTDLDDLRRRAGITIRENTGKWVVTIRAEDGIHSTEFPSMEAGLQELGNQIGRDPQTLKPNQMYFDEWGRQAKLSELPPGINDVKELDAYRRAYDARETGQLTPEQDALLKRVEGGV